MTRKFKIAFVLQGRFEAFELALALMKRGHNVKVLINYPAFAVRRFGMNPENTKRFVLHGVASRVFYWFNQYFDMPIPEKFMCQWFGQWAARELRKQKWDVIFGMSGVSKEFLGDPKLKDALRVVIRSSTHIRTQYAILAEEEKRAGVSLDKPSRWIMAREESEYILADKIRVLSRFSHDSFIDNGIHSEKLWFNPSAFPFGQFQTLPSVIERRRERILQGLPLRVLYVGNLSFQKGMLDLKEIFDQLETNKYVFRLVGSRMPETVTLFENCPGNVMLCGKKAQSKLAMFYEWADLFIYPTLQDGFPQVLAQAHVSGLPILATTNSSAPDFIEEGKTGWILPIRRPDLFVEKLRWCNDHREALAQMVNTIEQRIRTANVRTWDDAAKETEVFLEKACR